MAASLTPPQILCTVKAIYPFYSEDNSTLNFNKNDRIEVFTKLNTGWWNGWCNGKRGWFPSNYVEIVSEGEDLAPLLSTKIDDNIVNLKFSELSVSSSESFASNQQKDNWLFQTNDSDTEIADHSENRDRGIDQSDTNSNNANAAQIPKQELMKNWVQRKNPQGRLYYCNLLTQETTWDYDEIDKDTGHLKKTLIDDDDSSENDDDQQHITIQFADEITWNKLSIDIALAIQQLITASQSSNRDDLQLKTSAVVKVIRLMLYASRSIEKNSDVLQNTVFREPRKMVISSLSKLVLSTRMASEGPRQSNVAPIVTQKIQREANDVLVAARNFVSTYTQHNIPLHRIHPEFMDTIENSGVIETNHAINGTLSSKNGSSDSSKHNSIDGIGYVTPKPKFFLNQDLISNLQAHTNQIHQLIDDLSIAVSSTVQKHSNPNQGNDEHEGRDGVVAMYRTLSGQTTQFVGILDEINFENIKTDNRLDFNTYISGRQSLYEAVGVLFSGIQSFTNKNIEIEAISQVIDEGLRAIKTSLENIEQIITLMVNERKRNMSIANDDYITMSPTSTNSDLRISSVYEDDISSRERSFSQDSADTYSRKSSLDMLFPAPPSRKPNSMVRSIDTTSSNDSERIELGNDNSIKGGTLTALVERLTAHDTFDAVFVATFLLTYRSFCTTEEFVSLLEERYNILPPEKLTPEQLEVWTETKQKLIRLRVFNVLKNWLENYYIDEDAYLLAKIEHFTKTNIRDVSSFAANQLLRVIKKRVDSSSQGEMKKIVPNPISGPDPIFPKNMSKMKLLDTDPLEMARQLSIMDFKLYSSIRPIECLGKAWSKEDSSGLVAMNIKQSIQYCNRLTALVTGTILKPDEARKRAVVIKYWVQVAENCRSMNNFNTCMAILSGFDNSVVGRLKRTWAMVNGKSNQALSEIRKLMGANRNFQTYRDIVHSVNPPCIPFLGIYLQDLTFIEDGNPDYLRGSSNLINFAKRQKTAQVILELKQFQSFAYNFHTIEPFQAFIKSQLDLSYDIDKLYERSVKLEPKVAEATTVAVNNLLTSLV